MDLPMASRGTLTTLSTITCDGAVRPVREPLWIGTRNRGASTNSEVTGHTVILAWVSLKTAS
jgi:hypothetical protein